MMFHVYLSPLGNCAWQDGEDVTIPADATFVADWDGISDSVTVIKGTMPADGIPFCGWPNK